MCSQVHQWSISLRVNVQWSTSLNKIKGVYILPNSQELVGEKEQKKKGKYGEKWGKYIKWGNTMEKDGKREKWRITSGKTREKNRGKNQRLILGRGK